MTPKFVLHIKYTPFRDLNFSLLYPFVLRLSLFVCILYLADSCVCVCVCVCVMLDSNSSVGKNGLSFVVVYLFAFLVTYLFTFVYYLAANVIK